MNSGAGESSVLNPLSFNGMAEKMRAYVVTRRAWLENNVLTDSSQVPTKPTLTYNGDAGYPANAISMSSSTFNSPVGSTFAGMEYRLAEVTLPTNPDFDPSEPRKYEIEADWESQTLTSFTASQSIPTSAIRPGSTYRSRVRHLDSAGRWSHWSEPVQFVAAIPDVSDYQERLVVSEFMYNPPEPTGSELLASSENDDFEWLELTNISDSDLDLTDVRFTKGIDFDFPDGTIIAAGASLLIVKDEEAFEARYGTSLPVIGNYDDDNLANGGEEIKLSLGAGTTILSFTYGDETPWPLGTDGQGSSLLLVDPFNNPSPTEPTNWIAQDLYLGNPGVVDQVLGYDTWKTAFGITNDLDDNDHDGFSNLFVWVFKC